MKKHIKCDRCNQIHHDIELKRFTNPPTFGDYFIICPILHEPVIIKITMNGLLCKNCKGYNLVKKQGYEGIYNCINCGVDYGELQLEKRKIVSVRV
tara:strand:+ start:11311 stop:11598 length:288 start_codon:yes stop_codon:yes gene_type:complete